MCISAELRLGDRAAGACELFSDDPHRVHLADTKSCYLEIYHDQVSLTGTGKCTESTFKKIQGSIIPVQG